MIVYKLNWIVRVNWYKIEDINERRKHSNSDVKLLKLSSIILSSLIMIRTQISRTIRVHYATVDQNESSIRQTIRFKYSLERDFSLSWSFNRQRQRDRNALRRRNLKISSSQHTNSSHLATSTTSTRSKSRQSVIVLSGRVVPRWVGIYMGEACSAPRISLAIVVLLW